MPARARAVATLAVLIAVPSAAGCGSSGGGGKTSAQASTQAHAPAAAAAGAPVRSATVDIRSFNYRPVTIAVKKGGRVRWTNSDSASHTATADDRSFDTQSLDKGKSKTITFSTAGTFAYHCDFHPFMTGEVVVK